MRFLIKSKSSPVSHVSDDIKKVITLAKEKFSSEQLDRYIRASKVWFHSDTSTFEFEDTHV